MYSRFFSRISAISFLSPEISSSLSCNWSFCFWITATSSSTFTSAFLRALMAGVAGGGEHRQDLQHGITPCQEGGKPLAKRQHDNKSPTLRTQGLQALHWALSKSNSYVSCFTNK